MTATGLYLDILANPAEHFHAPGMFMGNVFDAALSSEDTLDPAQIKLLISQLRGIHEKQPGGVLIFYATQSSIRRFSAFYPMIPTHLQRPV